MRRPWRSLWRLVKWILTLASAGIALLALCVTDMEELRPEPILAFCAAVGWLYFMMSRAGKKETKKYQRRWEK